jgi:hypothetical protein
VDILQYSKNLLEQVWNIEMTLFSIICLLIAYGTIASTGNAKNMFRFFWYSTYICRVRIVVPVSVLTGTYEQPIEHVLQVLVPAVLTLQVPGTGYRSTRTSSTSTSTSNRMKKF